MNAITIGWQHFAAPARSVISTLDLSLPSIYVAYVSYDHALTEINCFVSWVSYVSDMHIPTTYEWPTTSGN